MDDYNFWTNELKYLLNVLSTFKEIKNFTFVGGSALAYYLRHRVSHDIDLFSNREILPQKSIENFIDKLKKKHSIVTINKTSEQIDFIIDNVNVTFCASGINAVKDLRKQLMQNLYIGKLDLLIAMKGYAIGRRAEIKDYFDIFALLKKDVCNINYIREKTEEVFGEKFFKKLFLKQLLLISEVKEELDEIDIIDENLKLEKNVIKEFFIKTIKQQNNNG